MFGPLSFEESDLSKYKPLDFECFLCHDKFNYTKQLNEFIKHSFEVHNLVIEDFQNIEQFDKYVAFWREKFLKTGIESIVPNVEIEGTSQHYFVLSLLLKDDKEIRHKLKLECVLEQQEHERVCTDFKRACLFCKHQHDGKLSDYITHLSQQHNLQLGKPENLVYTNELLNVIEDKLNHFVCIYCEKTFPDRTVLKEHMRKKLHKRINPSNRAYDKYFIINYLESDRNWYHLQKEDDNLLPIELAENSDQEWSDWNETEQEIVCLFCNVTEGLLTNLCDHMKCVHGFDFKNATIDLDFYQKVKLINYVRRQMHINHCPKCDENFESREQLIEHLKEKNHYSIPELKTFDQPEYYFPTYENDTLLYYLEEIIE